MKKIGIITYHRAYNYGSVLQAYALNKYLRESGFFVETIDYRNQSQKDIYSLFQKLTGIKSILQNIYSLIYISKLLKRKKRFDLFIKEFIPLTKREFYSEHELLLSNLNFDIYICGSDQIWNNSLPDFDIAYLLSFVSDKSKCIAYAPSIGKDSLTEKEIIFFHDYVEKFRALSIREKQGMIALNLALELAVDPTLLIEESEWNDITSEQLVKGKYIFCYFLGNVKEMRKFAKKMHEQLKLPLVVIISSSRDIFVGNRYKIYDAGPSEFLSLIKNSEYVCSNSYHALLFSVIYKKKFWSFINNKKGLNCNSRLVNIAELLGLEDRVININSMNVDLDKEIDYKTVNSKLKKLVESSKRYLINSITK
ncbi:MAG TPA: polysaccharide pyruvyl transferase family protein [Candidatus Paceibacterota bacterium]